MALGVRPVSGLPLLGLLPVFREQLADAVRDVYAENYYSESWHDRMTDLDSLCEQHGIATKADDYVTQLADALDVGERQVDLDESDHAEIMSERSFEWERDR